MQPVGHTSLKQKLIQNLENEVTKKAYKNHQMVPIRDPSKESLNLSPQNDREITINKMMSPLA